MIRAGDITDARELARRTSGIVRPIIAEGTHMRTVDGAPYSERYVWDTITPADLAVWSYGDWRDATPDDATYFLVDLASWSDYSGSTVERSNYRVLLEDYPDVCVDVHGGYGTRAVLIPADMPADFRPDDDDETRADFWADMIGRLAALSDYPCLDDEDVSNLEMELAGEAWDCYISWDLRRALTDAGVSEETLDALEDDDIREMFYTDTYARPYGPEPESAVSVVFPFFDDTVAEIARRLSDGAA